MQVQCFASYHGYHIYLRPASTENCCRNTENRKTEKLEKLNERALRFVYQDKASTYETLVVKNGHSTLANQRLAKMLSTVFRAIGNGNVPSSISESLTAPNSNYNLRGDAILKLPKVNSTKYGIKSCLPDYGTLFLII